MSFFTPKHEVCEHHNSRVQYDQLIENKNKKDKTPICRNRPSHQIEERIREIGSRRGNCQFQYLTDFENDSIPKKRERKRIFGK